MRVTSRPWEPWKVGCPGEDYQLPPPGGTLWEQPRLLRSARRSPLALGQSGEDLPVVAAHGLS